MRYTRVSSISISILGLLKMQLSGTELVKILVKLSVLTKKKSKGRN